MGSNLPRCLQGFFFLLSFISCVQFSKARWSVPIPNLNFSGEANRISADDFRPGVAAHRVRNEARAGAEGPGLEAGRGWEADLAAVRDFRQRHDQRQEPHHKEWLASKNGTDVINVIRSCVSLSSAILIATTEHCSLAVFLRPGSSSISSNSLLLALITLMLELVFFILPGYLANSISCIRELDAS